MNVPLGDLNPKFLRYGTRREMGTFRQPDGSDVTRMHDQVYLTHVDRIEDAQGVQFLCPKCFVANGGAVGTHRVICWSRSRGVPDDANPAPGRWKLDGTGLHDLTLNGDPGSRSVKLTGDGCQWHGYITNGEATDA